MQTSLSRLKEEELESNWDEDTLDCVELQGFIELPMENHDEGN